MDSIAIEKARDEHLATIPGIELAGTTLFSETDLPQSVRYKVTAQADLREAMEHGRLWVAVDKDRRPVGFAMADVVDGQAYLDELDVLPEFGRRGIGTRLTRHVIDWAGVNGFSSLSLVTFRHLPWNAPFYEKLGFEILPAAEQGPELAGLIEEEKKLGINVRNRVAMRLEL